MAQVDVLLETLSAPLLDLPDLRADVDYLVSLQSKAGELWWQVKVRLILGSVVVVLVMVELGLHKYFKLDRRKLKGHHQPLLADSQLASSLP